MKKITLLAILAIMLIGMLTVSACKAKEAETTPADTTMAPAADTQAPVDTTVAAPEAAPAADQAKPAGK